MKRNLKFSRTLTTLLLCLTCGPSIAAETVAVERTHQTWEQRNLEQGVELRPILYLPDGSGPFALVVIVNSSAGANDVFLTELPKALNKAGIAAVALDTFTPRGIKNTAFDQSQITAFSMGLDALAVARHFANDPRINPDRIAVSGHSKGANTTFHLANAQFYRRFRVEPVFVAGIAFSPGCFAQFASSVSVFPMHALMGAKDDYTPPRYCISLFDRMNGNPHSVSYEVVPDTFHSWSIEGPYLKFSERIQNISRGPCEADAPYLLGKPGRLKSSKTNEVLTTKEFRTRCAGGKGATVGGGRENLGLALSKAIKWIKSVGFSPKTRNPVAFKNEQEYARLNTAVRKLVETVLAVAGGFKKYCKNKRNGRISLIFSAVQKLSVEDTTLSSNARRQAGQFLRAECRIR